MELVEHPICFSVCAKVVNHLNFIWYMVHAGVIAFGFGSSWTLPLYASLKGTSTLSTSTTKKNRHSFQLLSLISIGLAVALTLPICFFAVNVTSPVSSSQVNIALVILSALERTDHTI